MTSMQKRSGMPRRDSFTAISCNSLIFDICFRLNTPPTSPRRICYPVQLVCDGPV